MSRSVHLRHVYAYICMSVYISKCTWKEADLDVRGKRESAELYLQIMNLCA